MDFSSFLSPSSPLYSFNPQTQTPQMLADRRARINALTSRIGTNPTLGGGIGDLIRGLGAGFANYRADQAQQQGNAYGTSAVDQLSSILSQPPSPGLPAPPSNDAVGAGIKQAMATGQTPQLAVYTPPPAGVGPGNMPMPQPAPTDMTQANPIPQPMSPTVPVGPVNMATGQAAPMRSAPMPQPGTPPIMQAPAAAAGPAISVPGYDGTFTQAQANDGDGVPSPSEWLAAAKGGASPGMTAATATPAAAPMVPASNDAALIPKIMQILNNPWVSDTDKQVLAQRLAVIQSHMDPGYQLDLKTKQATLDNLTAAKTANYTDPHSGDLYTYDTSDPAGTMKLVRKADPLSMTAIKPPAGYRYKMDGSGNMEAIPGGPAANPKLPPPPTGYRYKSDSSGDVEPIPGGPAAPIDATDPANAEYIKGIAFYKVKAPTAGRNPQVRANLIKAAQAINPNYDETKFDARQKSQDSFSAGPLGNTTRSLGVSVAHLGVLKQLGDALQTGDVQMINAAKQAWQQQFGSDAPTNYNLAKSIVADEVAKSVIGGQNAQSDRETLAANLKAANSPEQMAGVIQTAQRLMGGQLSGLRQQYVSQNSDYLTKDAAAQEFNDKFLSPETAKALDQFSQGGGASGPPDAAVKMLKTNPSLAAQFDQKYGAGSAAKALGN